MTDGGGDPPVKLRLTVLLALLGVALTGATAYATLQVSLARAESAAHLEAVEAVARHSAAHISADDFRELKADVKAMNEKLDRLSEDIAVLKAGKEKKR